MCDLSSSENFMLPSNIAYCLVVHLIVYKLDFWWSCHSDKEPLVYFMNLVNLDCVQLLIQTEEAL